MLQIALMLSRWKICLFFSPRLKQDTGSRLSRGGVFSSMRDQHYQCQLAAHLPPHCQLQSIHTYQGQRSPHTTSNNINSAETGERYFLQPVIDTSKVHESSAEESALSALRRHPPPVGFILLDNTRKTIEIYESCGRVH